jgi:hypothetical protein
MMKVIRTQNITGLPKAEMAQNITFDCETELISFVRCEKRILK